MDTFYGPLSVCINEVWMYYKIKNVVVPHVKEPVNFDLPIEPPRVEALFMSQT